jgi:hypothetical protein
VNWLVDGVSNVDVGSNITLLSTPTLESIQEFKIITSSYAAEWPRSGGGVVNVVTKSGTSKFSGSVYEFYRDDKLNENSFFGTGTPRLSASRHLRCNFGYTFGGPVPKMADKLFFFWSQEWRRIQRAPSSLTANVPNPDWLNDPNNSQYVAPALRDANALKILDLYPAPTLGPSSANGPARSQTSAPNMNNTRQEVIRVDYDMSPKWRITGRYTHDLSETRELGGLFVGMAWPGIATTNTRVPGQVLAIGVKTIFGGTAVNDLQFQRSSNAISTTYPADNRNNRAALGLTIELPENGAPDSRITVSGLSTITLPAVDNNYVNQTITDNFSWQRGSRAFKFGGLVTSRRRTRTRSRIPWAPSVSRRRRAAHGVPELPDRNADGKCTGCIYAEDQSDIRACASRVEMCAQDTRLKSNVTFDYGVRYSLYPPLTEINNNLATFNPDFYDPAQAPKFTTPAGTLVDKTTGSPTNGIMIAGQNSPYGDAIYKFQKGSIQPRLGLSWDPTQAGNTIVRASYGIYFDQPLVGIFEWDAFYNPPFNTSTNTIAPSFSNPGAGTTPTTRGMVTGWGTGTDFKNPRTMQWNVGVNRRLFSNATIEISYVGARGDNLIRPTDPNYPMPTDVVALQAAVGSTSAVNPARPYVGFSNIGSTKPRPSAATTTS